MSIFWISCCGIKRGVWGDPPPILGHTWPHGVSLWDMLRYKKLLLVATFWYTLENVNFWISCCGIKSKV